MKISVAMAYYNGGTYIEEQMDSILSQLGEKDEVIVSVDGASDGSKPLLLKMSEVDSRIHIVKGPGKGVVRNFENAIRHCNGDIIYLSDQDDIWKPDKDFSTKYSVFSACCRNQCRRNQYFSARSKRKGGRCVLADDTGGAFG